MDKRHTALWNKCIAHLQRGNAQAVMEELAEVSPDENMPADHSRWELLQGVALMLSQRSECREHFQKALQLDSTNLAARLNLDLFEVDQAFHVIPSLSPATQQTTKRPTKIALLSFLFNWPSTGGGIVHTVELADFLHRAGYDLRHFYARYDPWQLGVVTQSTPIPSYELHFAQKQWDLASIQDRYRQAVDEYRPDYVIVTDSWNMKPVLAEAVEHYPYLLRLQALECLCPLNNIRLLPGDNGGFQQCQLYQLATPEGCRRCVALRGQRSGSLHQDERQLAGVGTSEYQARLLKVFRQAHAVLVVNPLTEAMVAPYAERVRTVTAGMDPARFPDPWPDDPAPPLQRSVKQILFAGLIDETIKGFAVLHEACQILWKKRQDFELLVTADPPGRIDAFTRTIGWQSQQLLPHAMRSVEIVAVPAIAQEALGRTAVEAMAAGRPVVASRLGGLPFTVPDGATGLLFEPGNPQDLLSKLERLLDDADLRQQLGNAGRRRFLEHYAWPVIIEKHYMPLLGTPVHEPIR